MGDATAGLLIAMLFAVALGMPGLGAYRGRYRSWIYRGLGMRYGAFAVGWIALGLLVLLAGIPLQEASDDGANSAGTALGATGLVAVVLGLLFFFWMPPQLVPRWRRALLANSKLYRAGDRNARLRADTTRLDDGRTVVTWRRPAPVTDSEWNALAMTGMHVRPRLRLPARIQGPLPDRETGLTAALPEPIRGELLVDAGTIVFVQAPAEDARHRDNWFVVIPHQIHPEDIESGPDGTTLTVRVGTVPGAGPIEIVVESADPQQLRDALGKAQRPRRLRHTIDGQWRRTDWTTAT
ncbi:hypothetical protein EF847_06260 [Actinobacteria bacterium YIM 96077]|uniref:Uncharacterized protein n=1 Tax=Phytoactinopolyspora halophila TaxID=1981511 RepID=A0A329QBU2_9ACTN|nr:hypothetical protein [Phytoactinopolyspora halophila]AYY12368.1 hypothetical protein EF847_06260 [Actinobacteria bacterium YIM 96077]RAW09219.1 hypothetical protein DPM12_22265 [Phytoactinopolyspora halophila]